MWHDRCKFIIYYLHVYGSKTCRNGKRTKISLVIIWSKARVTDFLTRAQIRKSSADPPLTQSCNSDATKLLVMTSSWCHNECARSLGALGFYAYFTGARRRPTLTDYILIHLHRGGGCVKMSRPHHVLLRDVISVFSREGQNFDRLPRGGQNMKNTNFVGKNN